MTNSRRSVLKGMAVGGAGASLAGNLGASAAAKAGSAGGAGSGVLSSTAWRELAAAMLAMDDQYGKPPFAGANNQESGEARAYMADALQTALEFWSEADPAKPRFSRFVRPDRKVMGDNPDALYYFAPVRADRVYVVRGNIAGAQYTSFTVERSDSEGGMPKGLGATLNDTQFDHAADGSFEIIVGGPRRERNWLELGPDARSITTRHYFERKDAAAADPLLHVPLTIDLVDPAPAPPSPDDDIVAARLRASAAYFNTIMSVGRPTDVAKNSPLRTSYSSNVPNVFPDPEVKSDNRSVGYAAADNRYFMAEYRLGPDEALEMRGRFPECRFANVVLFSRYLRSFDFVNRQISLNRQQTRLEADGSFRMIIAHADPGVPNWIDTEGRPSGTVFWRFLLPEGTIEPIRSRVLKLKDV